MNAGLANRHTLTLVLVAALLAAGLSLVILRSPLTLNDGLGPVLDSRRATSVTDVFRAALYTKGYLRPLRVAQIKAVHDLSPADPMSAYKAVHVGLTMAALVLFAVFLRPASPAEVTAAAIALMVFAGHHSFFMLLAEAYPINHFLEMVSLTLLVAILARGAPRWWKDLLAPALLVIGLLTLESGILIAVVAVGCWLLGWRGISMRGVVACVVVVAGYAWLRIGILEVTSPGLDERAAGWGLGRLEPEELVARFQANPLPFYAYNVVSAFLDLLISQPRNGTWIIARRWVDGDVPPWMFIHLVSSCLVSGLMLVTMAGALRRWRTGVLTDRDRFVLLALALCACNAALSYGYVKDDVLSIGAAFYAAGAFAVLAGVAERVTGAGGAARVAAALLIACSLLWSSRAAGTFYSLRAFAYRTGADWARYSLDRELPGDAAFEPTRRLFDELRRRNVTLGGPHPAFTNETRVQRYVEIQ